jgi:hypothetical protein
MLVTIDDEGTSSLVEHFALNQLRWMRVAVAELAHLGEHVR